MYGKIAGRMMVRRSVDRQKGFTLIELLVVIAILAVLAAVAIPAYARFFGQGNEEANLAELKLVQNAMDAMMAENQLVAVDPHPAGTSIFEDMPKGDGAEALAYNFLRSGGTTDKPTKCVYSWTADGRMTQESCL